MAFLQCIQKVKLFSIFYWLGAVTILTHCGSFLFFFLLGLNRSLLNACCFTVMCFSSLQVEDVAALVLGKSLFVNWPHLMEARVVAVSDGETK